MIRILALFFILCSFNANAAKIGVVDIKEIVDQSLAAKDIARKVDSQRQRFQADVKREETTLIQEKDDLLGEQNLLSAEIFDQKLNAFQEKAKSARDRITSKRSKLENSYIDSLSKVRDVTLQIVADVARANNLDIVIPKSQALYTNPSMPDITATVLKKLNSQLPSVRVAF